MSVTLHTLAVFSSVVERQGIASAAEETGLSRSAVSFQVAALQTHFASSLLQRRHGRLVPTETGAEVHRYARHALAVMTDAGRHLQAGVARTGPFAIGAGLSMGNYILPELVAAFERETGAGPFHLALRNTEEVVAMIGRHELDLGVVSAGPLPAGLVGEPCGGASLVLIGGPEGALWGHSEPKPPELARLPFVAPPVGSFLREAADHALAALGVVRYEIRLEVEGAEAIKRVVMAGDAVAVVVDRTVAVESERGDLWVARPFGGSRSLSYQLVRRDTGQLAEVLVSFSRFLRERLA